MIIKKFLNLDYFPIFLIAVLPISLLISTGVSELTVILLVIIFLLHSIHKNNFLWMKNEYFLLLSVLWACLIANYFFSLNSSLSFLRSFGFIKYIILVFAINHYLKIKKNLNFILLLWLIICLIVSGDIFFEYLNKKNILGFYSNDPTRIASFLGKELKIGHFILGFGFIAIGYFCEKYLNKSKYSIYIVYCLIIFLISSLILTGERSNTIKGIIGIILFIFLSRHIFFVKKKKIYLLLLIFFLTSLFYFSDRIKGRFNTIINPILDQGLRKSFKETQHAAHYYTAIEIFKSYPLFGVGNKNFREECNKEKYYNESYAWTTQRCTTHPHQIYLELLSEHGLIGASIIIYVIFFSLYKSIKIFYKKKKLIHLSSILFIIITFLPIIPSGSFFTSWGATIFWINYSIMIFYNNSFNK